MIKYTINLDREDIRDHMITRYLDRKSKHTPEIIHLIHRYLDRYIYILVISIRMLNCVYARQGIMYERYVY